MRKLTKRVQAGGLWFDVPEYTNFITIDKCGSVSNHSVSPLPGSGVWMSSGLYNFLCYVALEGFDWNECCWYVGDQVDGEAVEHREWMAMGVELLSKNEREAASYFGSISGEFNQEAHSRHYSNHIIAQRFAEKIRAGEVEL